MTPISPLLDSNLAGLRRHTPRLRLNLLAGPYLSSSGALSARISEALPLITVELRNVVAKYSFERSHRFPGTQPNSGLAFELRRCGNAARA